MKNRKILIAALALVLVLALLLGAALAFFGTQRKITVVSGERFIDKCPRRARPGTEVTVTTAVVTDAEICVNGVDGRYVSPGVYKFTMPDEDVRLSVTVISNPNGA